MKSHKRGQSVASDKGDLRRVFDVIVVGGGHAGCEAAFASAKMGCETALLTLDHSKTGVMSCNPAIGGLAKAQLVKEIDALGGLMGRITDRAAIQYRILNSRKGPAVRSSRAQCDKNRYAWEMQAYLQKVPRLSLVEAEMSGLCIENGRVRGIKLKNGVEIQARAVVITSGTFLKAIMHFGAEKVEGGRVGEGAVSGLSAELEELGFRLRRLKTGTPPRLSKKTIDFNGLTEQPGDEKPKAFSYYQKLNPFPYLEQISCHITHTNRQTHEIIEENLDRSPLYNGQIQGVGPRYCPSIEDKIHRFAERERHQIFLEPEGLDVDEVYVNGVSTSLPKDVQADFIHSINGLERAEFLRYGYAVEYDAFDARQLKRSLEAKEVSGLFFAGQVNGTSGYEEAGAQGLVAGVNAALSVQAKEPWILQRSEAYAGVMIDDLTLIGSDEPYRMFTSRAEYRLLLREDNADFRLSEQAFRLGLLSEGDFREFESVRDSFQKHLLWSKKEFLRPGERSAKVFEMKGWPALRDRVSVFELLKRPGADWELLEELGIASENVPRRTIEQVEIAAKYEGYIRRDEEILAGVRKNESLRVPIGLEYSEVPGLSNEIRGRLSETRPETIGQVSRIQGVTPAAVANLLIFLKTRSPRGETRTSV